MVPPSLADLLLLGVTPDVIGDPFLFHDIVRGEPELLLSVSHLMVTLVSAVIGESGFSTIFSSVADPEKQTW
jgi:hypothetical protein